MLTLAGRQAWRAARGFQVDAARAVKEPLFRQRIQGFHPASGISTSVACGVQAAGFYARPIDGSRGVVLITSIYRGFASATPEKATDRSLESAAALTAFEATRSARKAPGKGKQSRGGSIVIISSSSSGGSGSRRSGAGSNGNSGGGKRSGVARDSNGASSGRSGGAGSNGVSTSGSSRDSTQSGDINVPSAPELQPHAEPATSSDWAHLVRTHIAAHTIDYAVLALEQMADSGHTPDADTFYAVLRTRATFMCGGDMATVIDVMSRSCLPLDITTYNLALRACRSSDSVQQADRILASMAAAGVAPDWGTFAGVLWTCRLAQDWRRAINVFRDIEANHPAFVDVNMWDRLLQVLCASEVPQNALAAAAQMAERGVAPTRETRLVLLKAHATLGDTAAVERVLSSMRAAGEQVPPETLAALAKGYGHGGHWEAAEEALEALFNIYSPDQLRMQTVTNFLSSCCRAGDLPRIVRWLQRLPSLGLAPTPRMWNVAVSAAHKGGDAVAADSLWRDAGGAAYFGLYKVLVPPKGGASRGWTVLVDHAAEQPHATSVALDVSTCSVGMIHAALRAEVSRLRTQRVSAVLYIYIQTSMPHDHAIAAAEVAAVVRDVGLHISTVPDTPGLFRVALPLSPPMQ
eukprot:TRINITY_DN2307_c0_g2_i9.p2 TRINITY_DN2307_c0_g2~~TRINITY_DN2307_c0_g2_i9.p2  ORF type:complete len:635 (-),score=149.15 TRINITY_DN2307_c0_g2_i9:42-1946(-)